MQLPRVLLADDHAMVADGLSLLLRESFELVGTAIDGAGLVAAARRLVPDVIIADIAMPVLNGLGALRQIKAEGIPSRVIFVTMHADAGLAIEALRAGASGYVVKHSAGEELTVAIHEVLAGRRYVTPRIAPEVIQRLGDRSDPVRLSLTARQRDVLRLVVAGKRMKEIAEILGLSARTVETHKYEAMQALGVATTAELISYAVRHELVSG
jgi:DNA-binding NarL/FixJ family response regulator